MEGIRRDCNLDKPEERGGRRINTIIKKEFREENRKGIAGEFAVAEIC